VNRYLRLLIILIVVVLLAWLATEIVGRGDYFAGRE
jgi:hypothetical protein